MRTFEVGNAFFWVVLVMGKSCQARPWGTWGKLPMLRRRSRTERRRGHTVFSRNRCRYFADRDRDKKFQYLRQIVGGDGGIRMSALRVVAEADENQKDGADLCMSCG